PLSSLSSCVRFFPTSTSQCSLHDALPIFPMNTDSDSRIGVFTSEPGLRVLQAYTPDVGRVRQAVRELSPAGHGRKELETENRIADRKSTRLNSNHVKIS